jgi:hypothetical protein
MNTSNGSFPSPGNLARERSAMYRSVMMTLASYGIGETYEAEFKRYLSLTEELTLLPHQHDIYNHFRRQLETKKLMIDLSELGSGKSYVVMKLALDLNLMILYISNDLAVNTMNNLMCLYGVRQLPSMSFTDVTAVNGRDSNIYINNHNEVRTVNKNYLDVISKRNILVVVDEVQAGKNGDAQRSEAIRVMLSPIYFPHRYGLPEGGSRAALLSGTLFDCKEHAKQMVYLTNFSGSCEYTSSMYREIDGRTVYLNAGFGELVFNCNHVNPALTAEILGGVSFGAGGIPLQIGKPFMSNFIELVYELFSRIVLPYYAHGIGKPVCEYPKQGRNVTGVLTEEQEQRMIAFLMNPNNARQFQFDGNTISFSSESSKFRSSLQEMMHDFKAEHIVRSVSEELRQGIKSVVYTDYDVSTNHIVEKLREQGWKVLCITGEVKQIERYQNIDAFNEDSSVNVIVCKKSIASCSINLHCKKTIEEGGEIRSLHMIPSFDSTQMLQSLERVDRAERATPVKVNIWWLQSRQLILQKIEEHLFNTLVTKVNVIKRVSLLQEFGIKRDFFTDYPFE